MTVAIPARPTVYEGTPMRSRMEARVAAYLDKCSIGWEYEPRAYASRDGQYLPDFRLKFGDGHTVYLEVKGAHPSFEELDVLLARMSPIRASDPEAVLAFCSEGSIRTGRFALNFVDVDHWVEGQMVRCPGHPSRVVLAATQRGGYIAPWCLECDPHRDVLHPSIEVSDYWVRES